MQKRAIKSRQRIFDVACKLFAYHGYAATPIEALVKAAKINRPTLYYYFGSKAGLYRAVVDTAFNDRMKLMQDAAKDHDGTEAQLTAVLEAMLRFAHERRDFVKICFAMGFAAPGAIPADLRKFKKGKESFDFIHGLIEKGIRSGELNSRYSSRELTTAIYAQFLIYAMAEVFADKHSNPKPVSKRIVEIFLSGARGKAGK